MKIADYLQNNKVIADGSFGTFYSEKYNTQDMSEQANTLYPERVKEIHSLYIEAGAKLIRTNTFASNTEFLDEDFSVVKDNIIAAVNNAKSAIEESGKDIFIAGDIGPIPSDFEADKERLSEEYYNIARIFIDNGIDILTFETFSETTDILPVIKRIKQENDVYIMVQFSVNQYGYSNSGLSASRLINDALSSDEIDAVGLNCGIGPVHMKQIFDKISINHKKHLIALPNAGYPKRVRGLIKYDNNPLYFAEKVNELVEKNGIDMVGGCCGTNPLFISSLNDILEKKQTEKKIIQIQSFEFDKHKNTTGFFYDKNGVLKNKKLIAVELAPPVNEKDDKIMEAANILTKSGVDVVTFPDSPSGRTRIDSVLMAEKVRRETGLNVMPHICCRDKNAIAMRSVFLGAVINDINNFLIITGDPVPTMARQSVKAVFNFDSVGLMNIARDMNDELLTNHQLTYGGAINQGRKNLDVEIKRVIKKMEAGAEFFFTQPIFSKEDANRIKKIKEETGARILCGIMPLISRKNALFMKNEIAGINISDEIVNRYPENGTKEENEAVGINVAKEMISCVESYTDGYYFSFPFNKVYLLNSIIDV